MSDDNTTPEAPEAKEATWKAPASQEELDSIVEKRLARERAKYADYDDVKAKAAEFDKAQEASKTELQKAIERAEAAEKRASTTQLEADRAAVALAKGLTPTQAKRLVGTTREELEADADELIADLAVDQKPAPTVRGIEKTPDAGGADPNDWLRDMARK